MDQSVGSVPRPGGSERSAHQLSHEHHLRAHVKLSTRLKNQTVFTQTEKDDGRKEARWDGDMSATREEASRCKICARRIVVSLESD